MNNLVIGVVGHIDHGKTTLIKSLTGIDADTLLEEKQRGMTIDIGFSNITFSSGATAEIIDVPGHKKFIKNMATGVSGINFYILVIACDDGIMPQTIEHFQLLNLLDKNQGIIVLTKRDLVTTEQYQKVVAQCEDFFKGSFLENKIFTLQENYEELLSFLEKETKNLITETKENVENKNFRLNIDKIYSIKGSGTVVTGTITQGEIDFNEKITLYPQNIPVKIKNIQNHGKNVPSLECGKRCAINISGVESKDISRGNILATSNSLYTSDIIDVKLSLLKEIKKIKNGHRVRINIGTNEIIGSVSLLDRSFLLGGDSSFAQILLDEKMSFSIGDIGIIRDFSPIKTLGKFKIINSNSQKMKKNNIKYLNTLEELNQKDKKEIIENLIKYRFLIEKNEICKFVNKKNIDDILKKLQEDKKILLLNSRFIHFENFNSKIEELVSLLENYHKNNHLSQGINKAILLGDIFKPFAPKEINEFLNNSLVENKISLNGSIISLKDFKIKLTKEEKNMKEIIFAIYKNQKFNLRSFEKILEEQDNKELFQRIHNYMGENEFIILLKDNHYILSGFLKESIKLIGEFFKNNDLLTIRNTRDILNCNRDSAILILEKLDTLKITKLVNGSRIFIMGGYDDKS